MALQQARDDKEKRRQGLYVAQRDEDDLPTCAERRVSPLI